MLALDERRDLARAMLSDILAALRQAERFERVVVISHEAEALALVPALGAEPLLQRGPPGYRAAAEQAAAEARAGGATALLVLPADLPLATSKDLRGLLNGAGAASVALVASEDGRGTNALLTRPPGVIRYRYGSRSFAAHHHEARRAGLATVSLEIPGLQLDVDRPRDLVRLFSERGPGPGPATADVLTRYGIAERLRPRAGSARPAAAARAVAGRRPGSPG